MRCTCYPYFDIHTHMHFAPTVSCMLSWHALHMSIIQACLGQHACYMQKILYRNITCLMHVKKSVYAKYSFWISRRLNVCWYHPTYTCTCMWISTLESDYFTHVICMSCNIHLHVYSSMHGKCPKSMHVCIIGTSMTCTKVIACYHLN